MPILGRIIPLFAEPDLRWAQVLKDSICVYYIWFLYCVDDAFCSKLEEQYTLGIFFASNS